MLFLLRHPLHALGLASLMVVLSRLGPVLQIWGPVPGGSMASLTLAVVSMIPLELYFLPRFLLYLDAEALDHPGNPKGSWQATFETRWIWAFVAKLILYLVVGAGMTCLIAPGLILLAAFGWTPFRVLLRGESLGNGAKSSVMLMGQHWLRVLPPFLVVLGTYFLYVFGVFASQKRFVPDPLTPWVQLTHPAVWGMDFIAGLLSLWISTTFLAVYHRLESLGPLPTPDSDHFLK